MDYSTSLSKTGAAGSRLERSYSESRERSRPSPRRKVSENRGKGDHSVANRKASTPVLVESLDRDISRFEEDLVIKKVSNARMMEQRLMTNLDENDHSQNDESTRFDFVSATLTMQTGINTRKALPLNDGVHNAGQLRACYHELGLNQDELAGSIEFDLIEAIKSFLYELAPSILVAPFLCVLLEGNLRAGINVARNRLLFPSINKYAGPFHLFAIVNTLDVFLKVMFIYRLCLHERETEVDLWESIMSFSWLVSRYLVIATKYGFFPPKVLAKMRQPPPAWTFKTTSERLLSFGWTRPGSPQLDAEVIRAMQEADIDLDAVIIEVSPLVVAYLRQNFGGNSAGHQDNEISGSLLLKYIIREAFQEKINNTAKYVSAFLILLVSLCPGLIRLYCGLPIFGSSSLDHLIFSAIFISTLQGSYSCLVFGAIGKLDLTRRRVAMELILQIAKSPGLCITVPINEKEYTSCSLYLDLSLRNNAFAWALVRRTARLIGSEFYLRSLSYIGILFMWAIYATAILNAIIWTQTRHSIATLGAIVIGIIAVSLTSIMAMRQADLLQDCVLDHRLFLKRQILSLSQRILQLCNIKNVDEVARLEKVREVLCNIDDEIGLKEEVVEPVSIFGFTAGMAMVSGAGGIVSAGLGYAWNQLISSADGYNSEGWYVG